MKKRIFSTVKRFNITLEPSDVERLKKIAARQGLKYSQLIRKLVRDFLNLPENAPKK